MKWRTFCSQRKGDHKQQMWVEGTEKGCSWIAFLMSLPMDSEGWPWRGWSLGLSASYLSFTKHLLHTPREQFWGAEVPASLYGSFREPGPSPHHCAAWPRLSQLTTLSDLK